MKQSASQQNMLLVFVAAAVCVVACACVLGVRGRPRDAVAAPAPPKAIPTPHGEARAVSAAQSAAPAPARADLPKPNEVGRIPVLMYHSIGERGAYDRNGLNIRPSTFRKHLKLLLDNGFYPVNARDLLSPRLDVPAGKMPVAITFDDARGSQFRYRKDGAIDPDCAVGILDAFHRKYGSGWPQRATFFVLPSSKYNPVPFWQSGQEKRKLQYLVRVGYEIANHSTSHHPMSTMDGRRLTWEESTCREYIQRLAPGATMDTMAVPYGIFPRTNALRDVLLGRGARCLFMAWGDPSFAPIDKRFDRRAVMRVGSVPGNIERYIAALVRDRKRTGPLRPYVSDGDTDTLTVPKSLAKYVNPDKIGGMRLVAYADAAPAKGKEKGKRVAAVPPAGRKEEVGAR